ncbi:phage holin [Neobacillus sp. D3-1R]|uniref:phage holin n=1 Tax=Neobacillus sp. D3-1R TaxID=3445778 RepID=UPI003FA0FECC
MINWKVRFKNKGWLLTFVSQFMILAQVLLTLLNTLGITDYQITDQIKSEVLTVINSVLVLLTMMGVIQDPTTKGYGDSERALGYKEPQ